MTMRKAAVLFLLIALVTGCSSAPTIKKQATPPVYGSAKSDISSDKQSIDDAIHIAETYLNAEKNSDFGAFSSVTPHTSMNVVFEWSYVNKSSIYNESAQISGIKSHLMLFFEYGGKEKTMKQYSDGYMAAIKARASLADEIEKGGYPVLGNLLKKGHWNAIISDDIVNATNYKLSSFDYIANVKSQSRAGTVLQKRETLQLFKMEIDGKQGSWKVLFKN
jgi:hypothetical protein